MSNSPFMRFFRVALGLIVMKPPLSLPIISQPPKQNPNLRGFSYLSIYRTSPELPISHKNPILETVKYVSST